MTLSVNSNIIFNNKQTHHIACIFIYLILINKIYVLDKKLTMMLLLTI
jgi:hypothetical protein